jgi:hypothetical protein
LKNILHYITVKYDYFYWYISTHTNLGNLQAVKKAMTRRVSPGWDKKVTSMGQNNLP